MRYYLLDKITKIEIGKTVEGVKCWSLDNEIFNEHFPGHPIVPGAMQIESTAQLLGFLISESYKVEYSESEEVFVLLSIVHKAKFRHFVTPGDKCEIKAYLQNLDTNRANGKAEVFVDGKMVTQVAMSFIVGTQKDYTVKKEHLNKTKEYYDILTANIERS